MARQLDSATRARRLLALLPMLRKGDRVSIAELARAVGCTEEEVTSDLTTLTMCGIPPFTPLDLVDLDIDGDSVIAYMDPPGLNRPLRLTMAEARALGAALEVAGYAPASPLRTKLSEICSASVSQEELERTVRTGTAPGGLAEVYSRLAAAADDHEKLRIVYYTGSTDRVAERIVHPWALVQRLGAWYLVAMCESTGGERVFRIDRIRAIEHTGETFPAPTEVPMNVTPDTAEMRVAEIRFAAGARLPDARAWPGVELESQPDGSTLARMPYQTTSWMARRVVAYLGDAVVLGPDEVRDAVRRHAEGLLQQAR
ncbi:MAG: WYL domain-containing protein [Coriobacteriia bacterium]|nr:WYL domain-containing protein [Coriobacteriia bacterium]